MNDLFETYIAALARRTLRDQNLTVHAQGGLRYCLLEDGDGGKKCFRTKPDILVKRGENVAFIIDTKWKLIGKKPEQKKHGVSQSDIYQMMVYARLYRCPELILLYPHHGGLGVAPLEAKYTMMEGEEQLRVASINLLLGEVGVGQQLMTLLQKSESEGNAINATG